mgnify:CR=1 FL=1
MTYCIDAGPLSASPEGQTCFLAGVPPKNAFHPPEPPYIKSQPYLRPKKATDLHDPAQNQCNSILLLSSNCTSGYL